MFTKNIHTKIFTQTKIVLVFLLCNLFLAGSIVSANNLSDTTGLNEAANTGFDTNVKNNPGIMTDIPTAIGKIIGAGLAFIGVLFFILMIYGGITWMMARGNESEVTKAKDLISSALIGLIIVLAAYTLTSFISSKLLTK